MSAEVATPKAHKSRNKSKSSTKKQRVQKTIDDSAPAENALAVAAPALSFTEKDLDNHTPFVTQTTSLYLPLSPIAHSFPLHGLLAEHVSPLLLTYYPPLRGVLLSYSNPRLSETPHSVPASAEAEDAAPLVLARSIDEYAVNFVWLTVDFVVLRPKRGCVVEGTVTLCNESYLGLVCWNFFNAGIDRRRLPKDWTWVSGSLTDAVDGTGEDGAAIPNREEGGYFVDGQGKKVEGMIRFRVRDFESAASTERERGFMSIEGTLLAEQEDDAVDEEVRARAQKGKAKGKIIRR
ncbi:hypothetical protein H2203_000516 [Taxawa tesnikishii (nom. ined.)]|nr:hypothetical protein H2203_000516 [Dothideales sp. JES 119]